MNNSDRFEFPIAGPEAYVAEPCVPADDSITLLTTNDGVEYVQTPDSAFEHVQDYPWEPNFVMVDGMRMHFIDVQPETSSSPPITEIVLMLHGQPSWSCLYRKMVPILVERGNRVICPDWLGIGKSDKPTGLEEHTYLKHVARLKSFISLVIPDALVEPTVTLFVQDWGSLIGLRTVGDEPSWFKRVVSANGNLPVIPIPNFNPIPVPTPVNYNCSDNRTAQEPVECALNQTCFEVWVDFCLTHPSWMASEVLQLGTTTTLSNGSLVDYNVPYPSRMYMAAIRAFPSMAAAMYEPDFGNTAAWESLQQYSRPFLALAWEDDPSFGSVEVQSNLYNNIVGASVHSFEHRRYAGANHFIQEDVGEEVAAYVADFIDGTPVGGDNNSTDPASSATTMLPSHAAATMLVYMSFYLAFKLIL